VIHLIVPNGLKQPASRRRSNRTFTLSYPPAIASRKSTARSIPTLTCSNASGSDPKECLEEIGLFIIGDENCTNRSQGVQFAIKPLPATMLSPKMGDLFQRKYPCKSRKILSW
jgi:hypothetical protein